MVQNRLGGKWSGFPMGSEFRKPNHLKSGQMAAILSKTFDIWTKTSEFRMVGTIAIAKVRPFEIRSSKCPEFKWSDFRSILWTIFLNTSKFPFESRASEIHWLRCLHGCEKYSGVLSIRMFVFQIPTVLPKILPHLSLSEIHIAGLIYFVASKLGP